MSGSLLGIKIRDIQHSKVVQDKLFEKGFYWAGQDAPQYKYLEADYLFPWNDMNICYAYDVTSEDLVITTDEEIDEFISKIGGAKRFDTEYGKCLVIPGYLVSVGCHQLGSETVEKIIKSYRGEE